jgi:hypothetical protein
MHAELILVLDDGRVAEQGTHTELLQRGGVYAALQRRQLLARIWTGAISLPPLRGRPRLRVYKRSTSGRA